MSSIIERLQAIVDEEVPQSSADAAREAIAEIRRLRNQLTSIRIAARDLDKDQQGISTLELVEALRGRWRWMAHEFHGVAGTLNSMLQRLRSDGPDNENSKWWRAQLDHMVNKSASFAKAAQAELDAYRERAERAEAVAQESEQLKADLSEARACGRVLVHAYDNDNRPPEQMLATVRGWPRGDG